MARPKILWDKLTDGRTDGLPMDDGLLISLSFPGRIERALL